jgi:hypothetical protein
VYATGLVEEAKAASPLRSAAALHRVELSRGSCQVLRTEIHSPAESFSVNWGKETAGRRDFQKQARPDVVRA